MITINCESYGKSNTGLIFLENHLGSIAPKNNANFFTIILDDEKAIEILQSALDNSDAIITIEFEDFIMEIR
jgi:hypothetical protein